MDGVNREGWVPCPGDPVPETLEERGERFEADVLPYLDQLHPRPPSG